MDLVFQHVQELLIHGLSSLAILANWLFKDIQSVKAVNLGMHNASIALFRLANWKLHMKQREISKPDLNPPSM